MLIGGLQRTTLIDYPGKIAATVFLCGCNFRCPWCYSSELVLPEKIKNQPQISEKVFFDFLKERKGLLEGVVICGGEPCLNNDLPEFCQKIKKLGFLVKLDTNGSNPQMLKNLIDKKLVDYVAMDIKAPVGAKIQNSKFKSRAPRSEARRSKNFVLLTPSLTLRGEMRQSLSDLQNYDKVTGVGVDLRKIKKSIEIIKSSGVDYEFRTTVVPTIHSKEEILQIARDISPAKRYYLQNFRPEKTIDPKFEKIKPYPEEYLLEIQKAISPFFEICQVR